MRRGLKTMSVTESLQGKQKTFLLWLFKAQQKLENYIYLYLDDLEFGLNSRPRVVGVFHLKILLPPGRTTRLDLHSQFSNMKKLPVKFLWFEEKKYIWKQMRGLVFIRQLRNKQCRSARFQAQQGCILFYPKPGCNLMIGQYRQQCT